LPGAGSEPEAQQSPERDQNRAAVPPGPLADESQPQRAVTDRVTDKETIVVNPGSETAPVEAHNGP
jgi:hypothetical protein